MKSTPTAVSTKSVFRPVLFFVLGLGLSLFGVFHCLKRFPGPDAFIRFAAALPLFWAVASFAIGAAAALAGLGILLPLVFRHRRGRQPQPWLYPGSAGPDADRGVIGCPGHRADDYGHDLGVYEDQYGDGPDGGYGGAGGGSYPGRHHDNGAYDPRRWAGARR